MIELVVVKKWLVLFGPDETIEKEVIFQILIVSPEDTASVWFFRHKK